MSLYCPATRDAYGLGIHEAMRLANDLYAITLARHDEVLLTAHPGWPARSSALMDALERLRCVRQTLRDAS